MSRRKTIMVGLDGATFRVLQPLATHGFLPTFRHLMENGVRAELLSCIPMSTGPAWLSMATGKEWKKIGKFDFRNSTAGRGPLKRITSHDFLRLGAFWHYLMHGGCRIGIVHYPMYYPAYEIEGFMMAGVGTPIGSDWDNKSIFPLSLEERLRNELGEYPIVVNYALREYTRRPDLFIEEAQQVIEVLDQAAQFFLTNCDFDFLFYVIPVSDHILHYLWQEVPLLEKDLASGSLSSLRCSFIDLWQRMDVVVSRFWQYAIDQDCNLILVSDHGFGPMQGFFNLSRWLRDRDYLCLKPGLRYSAYRLEPEVRNAFDGNRWMRGIYRRTIGLFLEKCFRLRSIDMEDLIDRDRTVAYCLDHGLGAGGIFLNREKLGPGPEYEETVARLVSGLKETVQTQVPEGRVEFVRTSPELGPSWGSNGPGADLPDLVILINEGGVYCSHQLTDSPLFDERLRNNLSGGHRREGIFIAWGPDMGGGSRSRMDIVDIAPTLLHLYGMGIPEDMDGRVLLDVLKNPGTPRLVSPIDFVAARGSEVDQGDYDDQLKEQLKSLGYL